PAHHDPRSAVRGIEERDVLFPPRFLLFSQQGESASRSVRIVLDEGETSFSLGQRWRAQIDVEHGPEPPLLALALMDHVLVRGSITVEPRVRADVQVFIVEHAPHGERLQPLAGVGVDEKPIAHQRATHGRPSIARPSWSTWLSSWAARRATQSASVRRPRPRWTPPLCHSAGDSDSKSISTSARRRSNAVRATRASLRRY